MCVVFGACPQRCFLPSEIAMPDHPSGERFKADMPEIPGIAGKLPRPPADRSGVLKAFGVVAAVLVVAIAAGHLLLRSKHAEQPPAQPVAQIDIPVPAPDPAKVIPRATESNPGIATVEELAKPWSSKAFLFRNNLTGEFIPAIILRLPEGSPSQGSGYWAFQSQAPYADCKLEVVADLAKLKNDYDYRAARYPMVGDLCSRTVFDPLKMGRLPNNVWVRGMIVQGSDLRPPLSIEVKVEGKEILAIRSE